MMTENTIAQLLREHNYIADEAISTAVFLAQQLEKPILIEGPPGVGKTGLAKTLSTALDYPLIRLQCYEGIDESKALYDWEYGKQLLYTQMLRTQLDQKLGDSADLKAAVKALADEESLFFSDNFLVQRPILRSFLSEKRSVLLIDEIDRSDDEFEALLLECLSDFQVSIPELGVISAINKPLVILTSNGTRMISDALRRRCLYLYIDYPEMEREVEIVRVHCPQICAELANQMVSFLRKAREINLRKPPSISETLDWAQVLSLLNVKKLSKEIVINTCGVITKHQADLQPIAELAAEELS